MLSSRGRKNDWNLAITIIPVYILIIALIYSVAFLWLYTLDPSLSTSASEEDDNIILLGLDSIAFDAALSQATDATLVTFYDEPSEDNPFITISYTYTGSEPTLTFKVVDSNGSDVSGSRSVIRSTGSYVEVRYPFTDNGSEYYTVQYTLSGSSDVIILRIELNAALATN